MEKLLSLMLFCFYKVKKELKPAFISTEKMGVLKFLNEGVAETKIL
jgi:hypothetical protein